MFESILNTTDDAIENYVFDIWKAFAITGEPWLRGMLILFVVITGYLILVRRLDMSGMTFLTRALKGMFIYVLLTNVGLMTHFFYNIFVVVPPAIASWVISTLSGIPAASTTEAGINQTIGGLYNDGMKVVTAIWDEGGMTNMLAYIYGIAVFIVNIILACYTLFLICLSKIALGVMLGLAPFFIVTYFFASTKGLFDAWLKQLITFALVPIVVYALYTIILVITLNPINTLLATLDNESWSVVQIAPVIVVNVIAIYLLQQVLNWASALGSGMQLHSGGVANATKSMGKKAIRSARNMRKSKGSAPKRQNFSKKK